MTILPSTPKHMKHLNKSKYRVRRHEPAKNHSHVAGRVNGIVNCPLIISFVFPRERQDLYFQETSRSAPHKPTAKILTYTPLRGPIPPPPPAAHTHTAKLTPSMPSHRPTSDLHSSSSPPSPLSPANPSSLSHSKSATPRKRRQ